MKYKKKYDMESCFESATLVQTVRNDDCQFAVKIIDQNYVFCHDRVEMCNLLSYVPSNYSCRFGCTNYGFSVVHFKTEDVQ